MNDQQPTPWQQRSIRRSGPRPRSRQFPADVARARKTEQTRRASAAQHRAHSVLVDRHLDEYNELFAIERAHVDAERGPLPGDEVTS